MSDLAVALNEYLGLRRALGFKLMSAEGHLRKFVALIEDRGEESITIALARDWATSGSTHPAVWAEKLRAVRLFARYRSVADPKTEVPPEGLLPHTPQRGRPYIYRPREIVDVLEGAQRLRPSKGLRRWTMATVFGLLAVTGLRVGEAVALDLPDVDLEREVLHIRRTKFGKSRLVPIHPTTIAVLRDYSLRRNAYSIAQHTQAFFTNDQGKRLSCQCVRHAFRVVSRLIGLRGPDDNRGPRLHDFRHTFAVTTLLEWHRQGREIERELPKLATYLGHTHWSETYWYLTSVPELMSLACGRLEALEERS
jgi:integrase